MVAAEPRRGGSASPDDGGDVRHGKCGIGRRRAGETPTSREDSIERHSPDAIEAEYDRLAADYERRWRRYLDASIAATLSRLRLGEPERVLPERVLDVGCGTCLLIARLAEPLPDARLFGVEPSAGMLRIAGAKRLPRAALVRAVAEQLPLRALSFDLVLTLSALHYWHEPAAGMREIYRVLRPGGRVVVTDWCLDYLTTRAIVGQLRLTRRPLGRVFGAAALRQLLEGAGFADVVVERYRISLVWGMMTAVARKL